VQLDPEGALGLVLRMAGLGSFFFFGATLAGAAIVAVTALLVGRLALARRAATIGLVLAGTYGMLLVAGPLLLGSRSLAPGQELAFCGFDCHLHLTVTRVARDSGLSVTVRARSDARREPEDPRYVALTLVDEAGARYEPDAMTLDTPLGPGDQYQRVLHFTVPEPSANFRFVGTWTGWPSYLVPGPDNIFAQRRNGIVLAGRVTE
jgi:hypothetical protein